MHEDADAVTGVCLAAACTAMEQIFQDSDAVLDDGVGPFPLDIDDETDPTSVMLVGRVVKSGGGGLRRRPAGCF